MDVQHHKDALLRKRGEILGSGGIKPLQASMENNTRQGDMADQASGNNEVHIQLKLKQTDAKILQAIEEALSRIDKGVYGICRDWAGFLHHAVLVSEQAGDRESRSDLELCRHTRLRAARIYRQPRARPRAHHPAYSPA